MVVAEEYVVSAVVAASTLSVSRVMALIFIAVERERKREGGCVAGRGGWEGGGGGGDGRSGGSGGGQEEEVVLSEEIDAKIEMRERGMRENERTGR